MEMVVGNDEDLFNYPSTILMNPFKNDTIIVEYPKRNRFMPVSAGRKATTKGDRKEYEILKRRFNEAKSVAK